MTDTTLKFGPFEPATVHVAVDMQRLFGEATDWHCPALASVLGRVGAIAAHAPERTIFTRFLTPERPEDVSGQWQHYYRRWQSVLKGALDPDMFELMPELRTHLPRARAVDKMTYSAFGSPQLHAILADDTVGTLVFSGVETDVCVLASVLGAVDRGYRTVLVEDAVASGNRTGHDAALAMLRERYSEQVEIVDSQTLLREWRV